MPIFESMCPSCGKVIEFYAHHRTDENPDCECGAGTKRLISSFGVVFTGVITTKYNDRKSENFEQEGHWAYRKRSSISGKPEPVWIENFQQQREFCKAEGLVNPKDLPNQEADPDGKFKSTTGCGLRGQWV